jgi:hypothetical protein
MLVTPVPHIQLKHFTMQHDNANSAGLVHTNFMFDAVHWKQQQGMHHDHTKAEP